MRLIKGNCSINKTRACHISLTNVMYPYQCTSARYVFSGGKKRLIRLPRRFFPVFTGVYGRGGGCSLIFFANRAQVGRDYTGQEDYCWWRLNLLSGLREDIFI